MFKYAVFSKTSRLRYWKLFLIDNEVYIAQLKLADAFKIALIGNKAFEKLNQINSLVELEIKTLEIINVTECNKIELRKGQVWLNNITIFINEQEYEFKIFNRWATKYIETDLESIFHSKLEVSDKGHN